MIENLRGSSTETKYGRIPLWLYETGVGLQAIATYGWLHGRYGHYERVMPSYSTLAKELKVSRGSVIAYVKALMSVGAVRIETSGAAGRQTNLYVIAFNEPFAVPGQQTDRGGQNTDQGVSGLYSAGQHADRGGQPVVQEEDVSNKTFEEDKDLSPPPSSEPRAEPAAAASERENDASPNNDKLSTAQQIVRKAGVVTEAEEPAFLDWVAAVHEPRSSAWWRTVAANGDLPDLVDAWRAEAAPAPAQPASRRMPPWCGDPDCSEIDRMRDRETPDGHRLVVRCKACHPDAAPTRASGGGSLADHNRGVLDRYRARVSGHQPYRDPEDHSVYDLGFDGRPLPGTDTTVAGWGAVAASFDDGT